VRVDAQNAERYAVLEERLNKLGPMSRAELEETVIEDLQRIARDFGIQFGGMSRAQLINTIILYQ
jgi:hypothetical protein